MKTELAILFVFLAASCATLSYATLTIAWNLSTDSPITRIYQKTPSDTNFVAIATVTNATTITLSTPPMNTQFYVTAVVGQQESEPSNIATNPYPAPPFITNLKRP